MEETENDDPDVVREGVELLTAGQVARMCGISRPHFIDLHKEGKTLSGIKLGRAIRWRRKEVAEWIAAGCPSKKEWENRKRLGNQKESRGR